MRYLFSIGSLLLAASLHAGGASANPVLHFSGNVGGKAFHVANYRYQLPAAETRTVRFTFTEPDAELLRRLLRANLGGRVSVGIGAKTTMLPAVRAVPTGRQLEVTLGDADSFAEITAALADAKAAPGK